MMEQKTAPGAEVSTAAPRLAAIWRWEHFAGIVECLGLTSIHDTASA